LVSICVKMSSLKNIKNQTPEICLAAVKKRAMDLRFVKDQTPEICLAAVTKYGTALRYFGCLIFYIF